MLERQEVQLERQKESIRRTQLFCRQLLEGKHRLESLDVDGCLEQMDQLEREGMMFMDGTHRDIHKIKQLGAILGAGVILFLALVWMVIILNMSMFREPLWVQLIFLGITAVTCVGVVAALLSRLKEIKGGEEDEASKY